MEAVDDAEARRWAAFLASDHRTPGHELEAGRQNPLHREGAVALEMTDVNHPPLSSEEVEACEKSNYCVGVTSVWIAHPPR